MEPEPVIQVEDVCKKFKVYDDKGTSLKERVLFRKRRRHKERQVLKGISFTIYKGETVGLIGKNGCGKSTLLKMLARILYPTQGIVRLRGRVSSLLELGAGFHPDLSGRENIFTNASIFGLGRAEIERRLDAVIRFSELEEFIDDPVRTYSSGMYMRLAFAVAVHVDADILLVDEILAVGDVNFQAKCFEKMKDIKAKGTTVVIVSHVLGQVQEICDRVLWIADGVVREDGAPKETVDLYLSDMEQKRMDRLEEDFQKGAGTPGFCRDGAHRRDVWRFALRMQKFEMCRENGPSFFRQANQWKSTCITMQKNPGIKLILQLVLREMTGHIVSEQARCPGQIHRRKLWHCARERHLWLWKTTVWHKADIW